MKTSTCCVDVFYCRFPLVEDMSLGTGCVDIFTLSRPHLNAQVGH